MHVASGGGEGGGSTYISMYTKYLAKKPTHTQTNKDLTQCDGILCLGLKCVLLIFKLFHNENDSKLGVIYITHTRYKMAVLFGS